MGRAHDEERFPYALEGIAEALRHERPALAPAELERLKPRARSAGGRSVTASDKHLFGTSRLTALATVGFLVIGTGGPLLVVGGETLRSGADHGGSAAFEQFHPPRQPSSDADELAHRQRSDGPNRPQRRQQPLRPPRRDR